MAVIGVLVQMNALCPYQTTGPVPAPATLELPLLCSGHETRNNPHGNRPRAGPLHRPRNVLRWHVHPSHAGTGGRRSGCGRGRGLATLGTRQAVAVQNGGGRHWGLIPGGRPFRVGKLGWLLPVGNAPAATQHHGGHAMPSRICANPGCPAIHDGTTGARCPKCSKTADKAHWARTKGYNTKAHRVTFRLAVLQKDPICVLCHSAVATVADHWPKSREDLIQLAMNPDDPRHGRGLCEPCHNVETARNQPGGWNARD